MQSDIDVVNAVYEAFTERDVERVLAHAHPEIVFSAVTGGHAGRTEPYRGHAGMREYYDDVERTWEELTLFANDFRAIPGAVVVMGHVEGRLDGEPVRRGAVWTWKVHAGKATEVRVADLGPAA